MGNCLSFRIVSPSRTHHAPLLSNTVINVPFVQKLLPVGKNCTLPTRPTPHLVCTDCRINLFRHSSKPNCPFCLRHIYTLSLCFYYRCFCCNQIKKSVTSSTHPHTKCHEDPGHFVCNPCAQEKHNCPICLKKINPHDVWPESSQIMHLIYVPILILLSFIITLSVGLLIEVLLLLLI